MTLSRRQYLFASYMMKRMGFRDDEKIIQYLNKIEEIYGKHYLEHSETILPSGYVKKSSFLRYSNSECIEELIEEIDLKKNYQQIEPISNSTDKISATDLSNFSFCPVSYIINKSFVVKRFNQEDKTIIGSKLHESLRLTNKKFPEGYSENDLFKPEIIEDSKIKKIKDCKLIFTGHDSNDSFFENNNFNYIGQPDYVFQDPNGKFFVVEEKFTYLNTYMGKDEYGLENYDEDKIKRIEYIKRTFHENHVVQIQSYIKYIDDYKIDYGILIYWFYDFSKSRNRPYVHSFSLKVINHEAAFNLLDSTYSKLKNLLQNKEIHFNQRTSPRKCAACVVSKYCAHKSGEFSKAHLPYKKEDLKLKYIEFPEELKK